MGFGDLSLRRAKEFTHVLPSPLVGEGGAKRRMRGLHPRVQALEMRDIARGERPLTPLRFAKRPSPTRGEGKKRVSAVRYSTFRIQSCGSLVRPYWMSISCLR